MPVKPCKIAIGIANFHFFIQDARVPSNLEQKIPVLGTQAAFAWQPLTHASLILNDMMSRTIYHMINIGSRKSARWDDGRFFRAAEVFRLDVRERMNGG
jgi:hypothetical protein